MIIENNYAFRMTHHTEGVAVNIGQPFKVFDIPDDLKFKMLLFKKEICYGNIAICFSCFGGVFCTFFDVAQGFLLFLGF